MFLRRAGAPLQVSGGLKPHVRCLQMVCAKGSRRERNILLSINRLNFDFDLGGKDPCGNQ